MTARITPLILCGGAGARLWPISRDSMPKQFAKLLGPRSLFQETVLRAKRCGFGRPMILTSHTHRVLVQQQLADLNVDADVLLEPARRDSGPAIGAGCLAIAKHDPDELVLVLAADHVMRDDDAFASAVIAGTPAAEAGYLVTFGIVPTHPECGYGYIAPGAVVAGEAAAVLQFAEKPAPKVAVKFVARGMLWNSGNFLFQAQALVDEYHAAAPTAVDQLANAVAAATPVCGAQLLGASYLDVESVSIDYAVMEHTKRAAVVRLDCGWSDVGNWDSLWAHGPADGTGNVLTGTVELVDSHDCLVSTDGPLTSVVGLKDIVVIASSDAVLVADRKRSGDIKILVDQLRAHGRTEADAHSRVYRPWGWYQVTDGGQGFQVKRIFVNPGGRLSLQKHRMRAEHWVVVSGEARVTVDDCVQTLLANQHAHIPLGAVHRLENLGTAPVELVEVQTGGYLGEDDIIRLEDVYERV